ncbi:MAG: VanZ family protein [Lewinellaceae bacterium]|nr:VanZ family protein [Lewinellaceae bacterium]
MFLIFDTPKTNKPASIPSKRANLQNFIPALLWAALIFTLSTGQAVEVPRFSNILEPDKVGHAAAYFVMSASLLWGFYRTVGISPATMVAAAAASILYGIGMEFIQYAFFPNRFFEVLDIIANIIGSISGIFGLYFLIK